MKLWLHLVSPILDPAIQTPAAPSHGRDGSLHRHPTQNTNEDRAKALQHNMHKQASIPAEELQFKSYPSTPVWDQPITLAFTYFTLHVNTTVHLQENHMHKTWITAHSYIVITAKRNQHRSTLLHQFELQSGSSLKKITNPTLGAFIPCDLQFLIRQSAQSRSLMVSRCAHKPTKCEMLCTLCLQLDWFRFWTWSSTDPVFK